MAESTVSRALNNKPGVSKEVKQQILELAKRLNYRPNALAQGLAGKKTRYIGVISPEIEPSFYNRIIKGIETAASSRGFVTIFGFTDYSQKREAFYLHHFSSMKVDGVISIGEGLAGEEIIKLATAEKPLVLINNYLEETMVPSLFVDHQQSIYYTVQKLISAGFKEIAFFNGPEEDFLCQQLEDGFKEALKDKDLKPKKELIKNIKLTREEGYLGICDLFQKTSIPEALITASEIAAIGALEALKIGGLFIPEDLPVVAYGDSNLAIASSPQLTTVKEPAFEMGHNSVSMLAKLIKDQREKKKRKRSAETIVMEGKMVYRESFKKQ